MQSRKSPSVGHFSSHSPTPRSIKASQALRFISIYAFGNSTKYDDSNNVGQCQRQTHTFSQKSISCVAFYSSVAFSREILHTEFQLCTYRIFLTASTHAYKMKNILASDYVSKLSKVFTKENSEKLKNSEIRKFEQLKNSII